MNADLFKATVAKYKKLRHINTQEQLRAHTTCGSSTTFRKYFEDPDLMPLGMWQQIMKTLNVPQSEQIQMLLDK